MKSLLVVFIGSFIGSFIMAQYFSYKMVKIMDSMSFEEKIKSLEKRITVLEDKALMYWDWSENDNVNLHKRANGLRKFICQDNANDM